MASSPEEAMVVKGAEALYDRDFPKDRIDWTGGDWHEVPQELRDIYADKARAVLTAALRLDDPETRLDALRKRTDEFLKQPVVRFPAEEAASDPETVERVAEWLHVYESGRRQDTVWPWSEISGQRRRMRLDEAREVLALLNTTDDKEAGDQ